MSRRIEVELTSARDDGSWTWRAAGAREPRGVVAGELVPAGSKVGDVMRADADFDLDGVTITSIAAKQEKKRNEAERIEIIGRPPRDEQLVTSTLTSRPSGERRERRPRGDRGDKGDRGDRDRGDRGDRRGRPDRGERPDGRPPPRSSRPPRTGSDAEGERPSRGERDARSDRGPERRRPPRPKREEPQKPKAKRL